ncbi:hypothetical protein HY733_03525 [Candidatus Uhrbacteria bacterium]|nr:hypothetical protein [Candidatus Uhrbacteria bacterium]
MSQFLRIVLIVLALAVAVLVWVELRQVEKVAEVEEVELTTHGSEKGVELVVTSPTKDSIITSPLTITGEAPGFWYFEATFPIVLVNWDGLVIAEGYATAQGEWMTEEMVPFTATLEFETPEYGDNGALILQKGNPSGLPENDDAIEISIRFKD